MDLEKGTLKWQTSRGKKQKPKSKGTPALKKAEVRGTEEKKEKESKHPFLTKERHSSKLRGSEPMKSAKRKQTSGAKRSS